MSAGFSQGLITKRRLSAALANEAVAVAVATCAKHGYAVTAIVVDMEGVRQAVLRGDGATVHTLDSAYAKAYSAASLAPVRKDYSTKALFERISKNPSTTDIARQPAVYHVHTGRHHAAGRHRADRRDRRRWRTRRKFR